MKYFFKSIEDTICYPLSYFTEKELEDLNFQLIEAIPDKETKDFIFCKFLIEFNH